MHVGGQIGQPKQGVKWGFVLDQFKHVQTYRSAEQVDDNWLFQAQSPIYWGTAMTAWSADRYRSDKLVLMEWKLAGDTYFSRRPKHGEAHKTESVPTFPTFGLRWPGDHTKLRHCSKWL